MLSDKLYSYIAQILVTRPILYPRHIQLDFPDGYQPIHLKCYRTARKVQQITSFPVVAGINFLEKNGKLFPWPHMVNATGLILADGLVDASPVVGEAELGFIPIFLNETSGWNQITEAYTNMGPEAAAGDVWGDANADKLTQTFMPRLIQNSSIARRMSAFFAIPESMPEL